MRKTAKAVRKGAMMIPPITDQMKGSPSEMATATTMTPDVIVMIVKM